jgi:hypothetical protein
VRVAFALDCCDREAMSFLATTSGVSGEDVRDLMLAAVEHRFGSVNRLPVAIEWLSDNGSCYLAGKTRSFARDIGLEPRTTPIESPQSNGMAEAFVHTIKRDYVRVSPCPDADTVMHQLSAWINHYNEVHRTRHSDIVHPVSSWQLTEARDRVRSFGGYNNRGLAHVTIPMNSHMTHTPTPSTAFIEGIQPTRPRGPSSDHDLGSSSRPSSLQNQGLRQCRPGFKRGARFHRFSLLFFKCK